MMSIWKAATSHQASRSHWKFVSPLCQGFLEANHPNASILPSQRDAVCHSSTEIHACCSIWICISFWSCIQGNQIYELYFAYSNITHSPGALIFSMSKWARGWAKTSMYTMQTHVLVQASLQLQPIKICEYGWHHLGHLEQRCLRSSWNLRWFRWDPGGEKSKENYFK